MIATKFKRLHPCFWGQAYGWGWLLLGKVRVGSSRVDGILDHLSGCVLVPGFCGWVAHSSPEQTPHSSFEPTDLNTIRLDLNPLHHTHAPNRPHIIRPPIRCRPVPDLTSAYHTQLDPIWPDQTRPNPTPQHLTLLNPAPPLPHPQCRNSARRNNATEYHDMQK